MKKPQTSIFQAAQDNWPEDEAAAILNYWNDSEFTFSEEEKAENIGRDAARMEQFFMQHSDGEKLIARFRAALNKNKES